MYSEDYYRENAAKRFGKSIIYRLRWVFHFADKPTIRGIWNGASQNPSDMAAFKNKSGLIMACIEGELGNTGQIKTMLEVDGHLYASCQWEMAAISPAILNPQIVKAKTSGFIIGLSMLTADTKNTIYIDGSGTSRPLTVSERQFKITEHKLGS